MKTFTKVLILPFFLLWGASAQTQSRTSPDCLQPFSFTTTGVSTDLNNIPQTASGASTGGCSAWIVSVEAYNSGAGSVTFQSSPSNVAGTGPSSYVTFVPLAGTTSLGSNPVSSFPGSYITTGYAPWLRVSVTVSAGTIRGSIQGWRSLAAARSGGGGGGGSGYATIEQAGSALAQRSILNFAANVTCADNPGSSRTDCTPSGGGGGYATIENAGNPVTQQTTLNFVSGATCVNNGGASRTDCTVTPGTANYTQSFTSQTSVALTHDLNTTRTLTQCYDGSNVEVVPNTTTITSANVVTVTFLVAQTGFCNVNGSGAAGGPTSQNDVTGSRSLGTVFQNTSGRVMWVNVIANSGSSNLDAQSDSSNPPTTFVASTAPNGGSNVTVSFIVLVGNFYKLTNNGSLAVWIEWN